MRPVVMARSLHDNINVDGGHHSQPYPPVVSVKLRGGNKTGFAIAFVHLGRKFYQMTLLAPTYASRCKWIEHITHQQDLIRDRSRFFEMDMLSEGFFQAESRVNCTVPFSELCLYLWSCDGACSHRMGGTGGGQKVAYGTFDGVYFQDLREPDREPVKVLALTDVAQVDVLDDYGLLIVLSGEL
jgi:RHO1 GDP-GTP exchange protein 1/2